MVITIVIFNYSPHPSSRGDFTQHPDAFCTVSVVGYPVILPFGSRGRGSSAHTYDLVRGRPQGQALKGSQEESSTSSEEDRPSRSW